MAFNTAHFARMPESKKPHTLFKRPGVHAGTMMHADIVPAYCKLLSPGEVINERIVGNIRMSTPIAPLYSSIKISFNAFFIPLRLVWAHTAEFFGENKTNAGPQTLQYTIPSARINAKGVNYPGDTNNCIKTHTPAHYLGKPLFKGDSIDAGTNINATVSILKERAYWLTINEWYRHEQVQAPISISTSDQPIIANGKNLSSSCAQCLKDFDYFTTMTASPQFSVSDVVLPLGSVAPVIGSASLHDLGSNGFKMTAPNGLSAGYVKNLVENPDGDVILEGSAHSSVNSELITKTNLVADLSNATAASIDEFYLAAAAQAWYHAANYGSKYFEMLQIHYGVYNPDLVMQRPEHCGEAKRYIQVQQVLSTAGAATDSTTKLGQPGANSSTNIDIKFPRYAAGEWGYYMILMNTYHERYYPAGVLREDLYKDMFDFYFPEFANIGDQGVKEVEAYFTSASDPETLLGFQEAWAEMRYTPNRLSGLLDPYADSNINSTANSLSQWTLGEKWNNAPTLSSQFLLENRDAIKNALITGQNGPDYIFYLYFDEKTLSEVPLFSVPGLPGRGRGIL